MPPWSSDVVSCISCTWNYKILHKYILREIECVWDGGRGEKLTCLPARARSVKFWLIGGACHNITWRCWDQKIKVFQLWGHQLTKGTHIWKPKLQVLWNHPFLKPLAADSYIVYAGWSIITRQKRLPIIVSMVFSFKM